MSASLNKIQIIGNLGRDPEIRYTADNKPIANLTVATTDKWKDKAGKQQEKTEWHRVVVFGGLAEVVEKYMKKGDSAYFEGKLQTRKWQDNNGQDKYVTEVVVDSFSGSLQMLGGKGGESTTSGQNQRTDSHSNGASIYGSSEEQFSDEIPF